MKYPSRILTILCSIILLAMASCHKKNTDTSTPIINTDKTQLNSLFADLRTTPQQFSVTAGSLQTIYGQLGTKITFYPNSFRDQSGRLLKGNVDIELIEMYRPGSILENRATTMADGMLLGSGGQVHIKATMGGQEIFANKYGIRFKQSAPSKKAMALFYGNTNNSDSLVKWTIGASNTGTTAAATDSVTDSTVVLVITNTGIDTLSVLQLPVNYYQFDSCVNFNWVNCDYFFGASAKAADCSVFVGNSGFDQSNTEVFLIFPEINAVTHLGKYDPELHSFSLYSGSYIPSGMKMDIVAITKKGGNYYYYQQTGIIAGAGMSFIADMQLQTQSYIQTQLAGL